MIEAGVRKDTRMEIVQRIRKAMPKMQRIWAHSALAKQGRDMMLETGLRVAEVGTSENIGYLIDSYGM